MQQSSQAARGAPGDFSAALEELLHSYIAGVPLSHFRERNDKIKNTYGALLSITSYKNTVDLNVCFTITRTVVLTPLKNFWNNFARLTPVLLLLNVVQEVMFLLLGKRSFVTHSNNGIIYIFYSSF